MSIFKGLDPLAYSELKQWMKELESYGNLGKLILLNFFEEERLGLNSCSIFCNNVIRYRKIFRNPIEPYRKSIFEGNLLLLLRGNHTPNIPLEALHFRSLSSLVYGGFVENLLDELPPIEISLKKPLGEGRPFIWITFENAIALNKITSSEARNLLGLPASRGEYLYYFRVRLAGEFWIPSALDAFGYPPFRPVPKGRNFGITRHLVDDSEGAPELIVKPLENLSECETGFLLDKIIDDMPPEGYIYRRLAEFDDNPEVVMWR
jgi:hypothetical protein